MQRSQDIESDDAYREYGLSYHAQQFREIDDVSALMAARAWFGL